MTDIAIIPARGGSKRIPRKNIRLFCGRPMIYYSILAALESEQFSQVIVSTDDEEIRDIAESCGARVPFLRPKKLADDFAPTVPVIAHAIETCEEIGLDVNYVACIYATAPFIEAGDLRAARKVLGDNKVVYSFPVCEHASPVQRALLIDESNTASPMFPENELVRTQDFPAAYFDAGQFYWGHKSAWTNNSNIHRHAKIITIPKWRAVDIDDEDDWVRAEKLFSSVRHK